MTNDQHASQAIQSGTGPAYAPTTVVLTKSESYVETLTVSQVSALKGCHLIKIESLNLGAKNPDEKHLKHQVIIDEVGLARLSAVLDNVLFDVFNEEE